MNAADLIAFEKRVSDAFGNKQIRGPVHLSGGNESQLIEIFKAIDPLDWVCTSYRNHCHALLHGVPEEKVWAEILKGHSMNLTFPEHRFLSSAIVGGQLSIAVGIATALKMRGSQRKVWCFLGDMASTIGSFHEASQYAGRWYLPVRFVIEDNGVSCNTPTQDCWGRAGVLAHTQRYFYTRQYPHVGIDRWVQF